MESEHLAPHGVPGGFKPMARSRRNSAEEAQAASVVAQPNPMDDPGYSSRGYIAHCRYRAHFRYTLL